jgi:hypothetical protein
LMVLDDHCVILDSPVPFMLVGRLVSKQEFVSL